MRHFTYSIALISLIFPLVSCTSIATLQRADISGSPRESVVKITDKNTADKVQVNIQYSQLMDDFLKLNIGDHSKVNSDGIFEVQEVAGEEYFYSDPKINNRDFKGNNLFWKFPDAHLLFEIEKTLSSSSFGLGLNVVRNRVLQYASNSFRIGRFWNYEWYAWRADLVIYRSQMSYSVYYIAKSTSARNLDKVTFNTVTEKKSFWDAELAFSINTTKADWFVNYFIAINLGSQAFYEFRDSEFSGETFGNSDSYANISAGLYHQFNKYRRFVLGLKINMHEGVDKYVVIPGFFLQYDFSI